MFIGSDSVLVAPVRIGDGAYIAAGSAITENVPADALGIARGRQVNKPGWAGKKRREMAAAAKDRKEIQENHSAESKKCPPGESRVQKSRSFVLPNLSCAPPSAKTAAVLK